MAESLLSPLNRLAPTCSSLLDTASQRASELSAAAQSRVRAEFEQFEAEAEKTKVWKVEAERSKEKLAAAATCADTGAADAGLPAPRRLLFSIDDDDDAVETLVSSSSSLVITTANGSVPTAANVGAPWEVRLAALMTIVEKEADAAAQAASNGLEMVVLPRMPPEELLLQLRQLRHEVHATPATATTNARMAAAASCTAAASSATDVSDDGTGGAGASEVPADATTASTITALQSQVEALSSQLAKSELQLRSRAETHRREVEALEARVAASEAETLDRMRLVAESVEAEGLLKRRTTEAEEELASVRRKAAERMKALIASNKGLEEEVGRLKEVDELNQSKMRSLEASLHVVEGEHRQSARSAEKEAAKQHENYTYARALVLRYLELEDQHEALFPALASAFKLTQQEVQRIQLAQQRHASENSLWGRTLWAGTRIVEAAREVRQAAASDERPLAHQLHERR